MIFSEALRLYACGVKLFFNIIGRMMYAGFGPCSMSMFLGKMDQTKVLGFLVLMEE
jgi:hypothetical protein